MKNLLHILIVLALMTVYEPSLAGNKNTTKWPQISPVKKSFYFKESSAKEAKLKIVGLNGQSLYLLECYLGHHEDPDFDYSGDFECRLTPLYSKENEVYSTLLTDDPKQSRDWESRGRFLVEEIMGKCAEYPEYGILRHFRLRGMTLTLHIKEFNLEPISGDMNVKKKPIIRDLNLDVIVTPDQNALSTIAEKVKYVEPPYIHPEKQNDFSKNCDHVMIK